MADSLILMVLALVVFGPRRLPQIGRQIGKLMYEFRKASNDFKFQMEEELRLSEDADRRKKEEEKRKQTAQESVSATPAVVNALESPYPGEGQYPNSAPTEPEPESNPEAAPESKSEEVAPRIQPPSTGETVAVERRSSAADVPAAESSEAPSASEITAALVTPLTETPPPAPPANQQATPPAAVPNTSEGETTVSHNG